MFIEFEFISKQDGIALHWHDILIRSKIEKVWKPEMLFSVTLHLFAKCFFNATLHFAKCFLAVLCTLQNAFLVPLCTLQNAFLAVLCKYSLLVTPRFIDDYDDAVDLLMMWVASIILSCFCWFYREPGIHSVHDLPAVFCMCKNNGLIVQFNE